MRIAGNKVILRTAEEQDRELLLSLSQDPDIAKVTGGYLRASSYVHPIAWFDARLDRAGDLRRIIAAQENPCIGLGVILLSHIDWGSGAAEIYIKIRKSARRNGYGEDAVNTLVPYAFGELGLNCIKSKILEYNTISQSLFEKCGFQQIGIHKGRAEQGRICRNVYIYERKR